MALPAALLITLRLTSRSKVQRVERDRFQAVRLDVAKRKIGLRYSDKARTKIAIRPDDSKGLAVITARDTVPDISKLLHLNQVLFVVCQSRDTLDEQNPGSDRPGIAKEIRFDLVS